MVDCYDLMVGNWVLNSNGEKCKVHDISDVFQSNITVDNYDKENDGCFELIFDGDGIKVTPGILLRNGFVENTHAFQYPYYELEDKENGFKIGYAFPSGSLTQYTKNFVYIDAKEVLVEHLPCLYLHELQQALRISGIKKTLEPWE